MKQKRDIAPYMGSSDENVNASLTWGKMLKRLRLIDPSYKPTSRYRMRLQHKRAMRRMRPGVVR